MNFYNGFAGILSIWTGDILMIHLIHIMTFADYGFEPSIMKAISELGFETPTPIQELTFQHFSENETDLIGLAQTGTGKTAAFSLPILQTAEVDNPNVQAIILSPTRELCNQIANDIASYSKHMVGINCLAVYGGANIMTQIKQLRDGVTIVVGTPGRTLDLIKRKKLKLENINWLVFDEADEMLSMGFKDDLDAILEACPKERKTLLFSATMPKEIQEIGMNYMNNPARLSAGSGANVSAVNIIHKYYMVGARDRYTALKRLADVNPDIYAIIFCRTKLGTQEVADKLGEDGYNADALHGDMSQAQRDFVMARFRKKQIQMLVATDVAARGIDVEDLTHVIHYQLPDENEIYIHRSGRTGRAGKEGESLSIIHSRESRKIRDIERTIKKEIELAKVPTGDVICEAQLYHLVKKVHDVDVNEQEIEPYLTKINEELADLSREDLIKRFISVEFNRFLDYYNNARDINVEPGSRDRERKERTDRGERGGTSGPSNMTKMVINHGRKSGLTPPLLISFLNEMMEGTSFDIGKIDINAGNSTFWVDKHVTKDLEKAVKKSSHTGVAVFEDKDQTDDGGFTVSRRDDRGGGGRSGGGRSRGGSNHRKGGGSGGGGGRRDSGGSGGGGRRKRY